MTAVRFFLDSGSEYHGTRFPDKLHFPLALRNRGNSFTFMVHTQRCRFFCHRSSSHNVYLFCKQIWAVHSDFSSFSPTHFGRQRFVRWEGTKTRRMRTTGPGLRQLALAEDVDRLRIVWPGLPVRFITKPSSWARNCKSQSSFVLSYFQLLFVIGFPLTYFDIKIDSFIFPSNVFLLVLRLFGITDEY